MAEEDLRSRTSMMEGRFLAGEPALFERLRKVVGGAGARRKAQEYFGIKDPDYYEYEGNIFFDDAMEENENGEFVPNKFVQILVSVIDQAAT